MQDPAHTRWLEQMIERGWIDRFKHSPPHYDRIEYHSVWNGRIYSGRCTLGDYPWSDASTPGHHCFLIGAALPVGVGPRVWRMAKGSE
ncbi:hypothetical protein [Salinicola endophyticus]|uniref:Uncharacterized protein n=1 Tax=Salinicola endophyticus TaxID=1949083 RepID=A0AB74UG24_9GAMM